MSELHTGELLFHCWQHQDRKLAYRQFESVISRGLLLTINPTQLDSFTFLSAGAQERIEVMQKARTCFTEIPFHLLRTHPYGHFAIGFTRKTIVDWGGLPAWYLPNHPGNETLKELAAEIIRGLHASAIAIDNLQSIARDIPPMLKKYIPEQYLSRSFDIALNFTHGKPLSGEALQSWLERSEQVTYHILSCIKEMSSRDIEDYRYLNEREWRVVAGAAFGGKEVCRPLTENEKVEFGQLRPAWLAPLTSADVNVQVRYQPSRIIDHFRFFNGIKSEPISRKIDTILVPDSAAKRWIRGFIATHATLFRPDGPTVRLFPSTRLRIGWWSLTSAAKILRAGGPSAEAAGARVSYTAIP